MSSVPAATNPLEPLAHAERVELILSQLESLPPMPAVASRLLELTSADESSAKDIIPLIESDPALTAAILKMVRRVDLGVRGANMMTVARAVVLLGFATVRNAVLSIQVHETLSAMHVDERSSPPSIEFWKHSLAVACVAEMIASKRDGKQAGDSAFVCGLLHDVGKLALRACLPKSYARVIDRVAKDHVCICDAERDLFGLDHTVAGKRLARLWRLPEAIAESAWLHHHGPDTLPAGAGERGTVQIVHLADNLVRQQRIGYSGYQYVASIDVLAPQLGVDPDSLPGIVEALPKRMEPYCQLVGLDTLDETTIHTQSPAAVHVELAQANSRLAQANRELHARSSCFECLNRFTGALTDTDRVAEVCAAAASAVRWLLASERAIGFVPAGDTRSAHVGVSVHRQMARSASIMDLGGALATSLLTALNTLAPAGGFVRAAEPFTPIWQRHFGGIGGSIWLLPIADMQTPVGAVLCETNDGGLGRLTAARTQCAALSSAIGMAVSAAMNRARQDRMNEELLDLNRRLHAAQEQLVRTRSVAMVAKMAAGGAHELNNPLAVISGRAQLLRSEWGDDSEEARPLDIIIEQAKRASEIVLDLMRFAKPEPPEATTQPLAAMLESVLQRWRADSSLRSDQIELRVADAAATFYADRRQVEEVLSAILANAIEATDPETALVQVNSPSRVSDDTVRIAIEDNGVGMDSDVLEHALDPFFSSRPAGRGRGLGLSRAYRLVENNGGRLWLQSTPNMGTTVTIELPARAPAR